MVHWSLPHNHSYMGSAQLPPAIVRFGVFEADLRAGELRRNGTRVRLQDLPFRMLTLLLTRPAEVITRDEFRQALWPPDVFVDFEQGISSAVMRLRDALGDSADNPIFVATIERRGYRWIAPIQRVDPVPEQPREEKSPEPGASVGAELPERVSPWWKLVFVLPVLVLLFTVWMLRPSFRNTRANAKSNDAHSPKPESGLGSIQPGHRARSKLFRRLCWPRRLLQPAA